MNITKQKRILLLLLAALLAHGCCREKDEPEEEREVAGVSFYFLKGAPYVPADSYPEWLQGRIDYEIGKFNNPSPDDVLIKIQVFQGEWDGQIVYFVYNSMNSCLLCFLYYENGEGISFKWNPWLEDNFCKTSTNWKLIFDYGKGITLPGI
jgi:hypothetical protein